MSNIKPAIILLAFFGICISFSFAQFDIEAEVFNKISKEVCTCLTDAQNEEKNIDNAVQTCMESAAMNHMVELMEIANLSELTPEEGEKLGELIGMKVMRDCPTFIEMAIQMSREENEAVKANQISGVLKKISGNDLGRIIIETPEGIEEVLYIIHPLEEDPDNILSSISSYKGQEITVNWMEAEVYTPKISMFAPVKQVVAIRLSE
ncbi:MAG: hypothetical protein AAF824_00335 [Bacteroidota bacterium]